MRINGFEQLKSFYSWVFNNQDKNVKSQHISLYVFLLNQNNRNNWVEWFKCPFDLAMSGSAIGNKKTYYNCLKDLQEWGLIDYRKGINDWKAPTIKIEVLKCTSTDTATVPQSEPLPIPLPTHIYKLITNNLKLVESNIERWIENELGKEDKKDGVVIPTFDEFKEHGIEKLKELGKNPSMYIYSLKAKYESWVESGWVDGKGKEIIRWKAKLSNTIPYLLPHESSSQYPSNMVIPM